MVFEKIVQPDSADDVARVVYSRRTAAEAARVNNSRHTCCCIYFSKTIKAGLSSTVAPRLGRQLLHLFLKDHKPMAKFKAPLTRQEDLSSYGFSDLVYRVLSEGSKVTSVL